MKTEEKIIIFRDGKTHLIPTNIVGFNKLLEVNGAIVDCKSSEYVAADVVQTLRLVNKTDIPVEYVYGDDHIAIADYDAKIELLKRSYKEKIDEQFDNDGNKINICMWTDKDAEKAYYVLTNKYKCVYKPMLTYGNYLAFEIVALPKTNNPFIVPCWRIDDKLSLMCKFKRNDFIIATVKKYIGKNRERLTIKDYTSPYSTTIYINDTKYEVGNIGNVSTGTLSQCLIAEKVIEAEVAKWFTFEAAKSEAKSVVNLSTMHSDVKAIKARLSCVKSKVASHRDYARVVEMVDSLLEKINKEMLK